MVSFGGQNSGLLRLSARIHLNKTGDFPALLGDLLGDSRRDLRPVDGLDHVKKLHRFISLVALQRPDQMQFHTGNFRPKPRPFAQRFLHPVFTKNPLTCSEHRLNLGCIKRL